MKKHALLLACFLALWVSHASAQSRIDQLGAAAALSNTDIIPLCQGCNASTAAVGATGTQLGTFITSKAVSSVAAGCGSVVSPNPIVSTGTVSASEPVNAQTGTTYAIANADCGGLTTFSNGSAIAVSLAQAGAGGNFAAGWYADYQNLGAGTVTITPATSTINGAATITLITGQGFRIVSDGTNYQITSGRATDATLSTSDITTNNVSTSKHGFAPKTPNDATKYLDGTGAYTVPAGGTGVAVDVQVFVAGGTWTRPASVTEVYLFGCGGGGQGAGGATVVSGTASSGGAGGGGGDCHAKILKAADAGPSQTIAIGAGGSAAGSGSSTAGGANGSNGSAGASTTFGALETWFGGGGGQGGKNSASATVGGTGGGPFAAGPTGSIGPATGCPAGGGGNGAVGGNSSFCGSGGAGGSSAGVAFSGGYGLGAAPGGGSGGGVTTVPAAVAATGTTGGGSLGCQSPPSGGAINTVGGTLVAPDFNYHAGCGGAGGGGALGNVGAPGAGSAGTSGGGGGGGGSVCSSGGACTAQIGGQGGNGGTGFLLVISR